VGVAGCAILVGDHAQRPILGGQAQHGLDKVPPFATLAPDSKKAAGPDHQVVGTKRLYHRLCRV
jgi:hypothetical protein